MLIRQTAFGNSLFLFAAAPARPRLSAARGVGQPDSAASADRAPPAWFGPPLLPSVARGVLHPASLAASAGFSPGFMPRRIFASGSSPCPLFVVFGVGQPASNTKSFRLFDRSGFVILFSPPDLKSRVCGVCQPASGACWVSEDPVMPAVISPPRSPSVAEGVVHPFSCEIETLSDMGRADARSAKIERPLGVSRIFEVSLYKVDPCKAIFARNLLAKNICRAALSNEVEPCGPEVPLVSKPAAFACRAERLAGA
jgi:hypothetical protein